MVVVQLLAFGKVSNNRVRRRTARGNRVEKNKLKREGKSETMVAGPILVRAINGVDGVTDSVDCKETMSNCRHQELTETDNSMTETSEEEIIV